MFATPLLLGGIVSLAARRVTSGRFVPSTYRVYTEFVRFKFEKRRRFLTRDIQGLSRMKAKKAKKRSPVPYVRGVAVRNTKRQQEQEQLSLSSVFIFRGDGAVSSIVIIRNSAISPKMNTHSHETQLSRRRLMCLLCKCFG